MTSFDQYVFILCLIVFVLLTAIFSTMLFLLTKQNVRLIELGEEDERIYKEYHKSSRVGGKKTGWFSKTITVVLACTAIAAFCFAINLQFLEKGQAQHGSTIRVVYSNSMSDKHEKNKYLEENDLNDQFKRFDLILTYKLPKEEDLKLYDIVVYEVDKTLIVHRIVGIEEPNEKHPDGRLFTLQGDMVERADARSVRYDQMKAIYRGERIPNIGHFVMFLQSPAGYMCIILIVVEMIASPFIDKALRDADKRRLKFALYYQSK